MFNSRAGERYTHKLRGNILKDGGSFLSNRIVVNFLHSFLY